VVRLLLRISTFGLPSGLIVLYSVGGNMSESVDLRQILKSWPYDPEKETRIVPGEDGRPIL